MVIRNKMPKDQ